MRCDRAGCLTEASDVSITDEPHQTKSAITQIAQIDGKDVNEVPQKAQTDSESFCACSAFLWPVLRNL
jgi:hypothetical protein